MTVSGSVDIAAGRQTIWEQVADPAQMSRWSPENTGAPVGAGKPLGVGDVFQGTNKRGSARWTTSCTVTVADPGRAFAFDVVAIGVRTPRLRSRIATWTYTFADVGGQTKVTETWTDLRTGWPDWVAAAFDKVATGGSLFSEFQRRNIARTLKNLKADFESIEQQD